VPRSRRLVKLIWVYKVKRSGKLKARLCVQGCTQVPGVDYDQTFCAAMRGTSLRLLASLAAGLGLKMRRWDFVSAYLQGSLLEDEVVYCHMPPGYEKEGKVCKVVKPVYGMAQAGRRWQRSLFPWLISYGLTQSENDPCVFSKERTLNGRTEILLVGCYVDDLFVLTSHDDDSSLYTDFTTKLQASWEVEDEGEVSDLLNIEIEHDDNSVTLRQVSYILKLMATYVPDGVPPSHQATKTPCDTDLPQLVADALAAKETPGWAVDPKLLKEYQSLVGALLYCSTNTRPDIAYAVGMLCRTMACPTPELLEAAHHVLFYLHRHRNIGLRYERSDAAMYGMSDSDWAVKHSTSGWLFMYNLATISWSSKKQTSVALSSCEAEIVAASEAAKEAKYLRMFLAELGFGDPNPTAQHMDNTGGRNLAYNPEHHQKTKHIERRHFYVRELVESLELSVPFVRTEDNMADFFTKPLKSRQFFPMRDKIMNVPAAQSGGAKAASSRRAYAARGG
jgi:hypothetical protein